jgi:methylmalonyl-CoA mutase N-terminal domain/subunit
MSIPGAFPPTCRSSCRRAHFVHPIDPAGGSWYIEKLADSVAHKAGTFFQDVKLSV